MATCYKSPNPTCKCGKHMKVEMYLHEKPNQITRIVWKCKCGLATKEDRDEYIERINKIIDEQMVRS